MGDELDDALDELRRDFVTTQLAPRIAALATLVADIATSDAAREAARRAAHMLRGTSGSYGLAELSAALTPLEEMLGKPIDGAAGAARAQSLFDTAHALALAILRAHGLA